jgi:hypothetical protein
MPMQDALNFFRAARRDEDLIRALDVDADLDWTDLVEIGTRAGFDFTLDELQRAHGLDWTMRLARYSGDAKTDAP